MLLTTELLLVGWMLLTASWFVTFSVVLMTIV